MTQFGMNLDSCASLTGVWPPTFGFALAGGCHEDAQFWEVRDPAGKIVLQGAAMSEVHVHFSVT